VISTDAEDILAAEGIILPGVGAFREGMEQLGELKSAVIRSAREVPLLGICLGMQMLMECSEEHGLHMGLSLVPGVVRRFPRIPGHKIPHMGWNQVRVIDPDHPLFEGYSREEYVYFVHSYFADTTPEYILTSTDYICRFASTIGKDTVYGVQFHPEKSGAIGLLLLRNFIGML